MELYNIDSELLGRLHYCIVEQGYQVPCVCAIEHDHTDQEFYYDDDE